MRVTVGSESTPDGWVPGVLETEPVRVYRLPGANRLLHLTPLVARNGNRQTPAPSTQCSTEAQDRLPEDDGHGLDDPHRRRETAVGPELPRRGYDHPPRPRMRGALLEALHLQAALTVTPYLPRGAQVDGKGHLEAVPLPTASRILGGNHLRKGGRPVSKTAAPRGSKRFRVRTEDGAPRWQQMKGGIPDSRFGTVAGGGIARVGGRFGEDTSRRFDSPTL